MKLETILDAMVRANIDVRYYRGFLGENTKRVRQYHAFCARILRMDADKERRIDELHILNAEYVVLFAAKDARIAELEGELDLERRINLEEGE